MSNIINRNMIGTCLFASLLASCGPSASLVDVRGREAPTAMFVFFDKDSSVPQPESESVVKEAAAYLTQYDNTLARIVGHVASDEPLAGDANQRLDRLRASAIGADLMRLGVSPERIQPVIAGRTENMADRRGDPSIDRRVEILFGVQ